MIDTSMPSPFLFKIPPNFTLLVLFINFHPVGGCYAALRFALRGNEILLKEYLRHHIYRFGWRNIA
jgi:hypothetical protein